MSDNQKNYKDTLNLPSTNFSMKANLANKEPLLCKEFAEEDIYNQIRKKSEGKPKYILHDGPPYANGNIHMGHALNKILKDVLVKYKTMQGFDSPYVPGWDCHGLPIEHQLLKEMKKTQHDVDQVDFRKKAFEYATKYVEIQKEQFKRLGIFAEWDKPYLTTDKEYETAIIESFIDLYKQGYIYRGLRPIHWCVSCETALAEAEVEYADHKSESIYVRFAADTADLKKVFPNINPDKKASFLIWTTTPWTIPANMAICIKSDFEYAAVETDTETLILSKDLAPTVLTTAEVENYEIKDVAMGKYLEGLKPKHPFADRVSPIILGDHVTLEQGTGCVHTAPGHGEDDFRIGKKYGIEIYNPVNGHGKYVPDTPHFAGMHVFKANPEVVKLLKEKDALFFSNKIEHSYPHCWRCKKPIIFRTTNQWFLRVDHNDLRTNLLKEIDNVKWQPKTGEHRINGMIKTRPDWCLSRQRLWGVFIPVFYCKDCGAEFLSDASAKKLIAAILESGADAWFEKEIKDFLEDGAKCEKCGSSDFEKENDILDVWFESGVSHQGVLKNRPYLTYPADLYLEGSDQHRGWFQTSLITSVCREKQAAFKTVLTHGFVVDGEGKKMSKSQGNVISPLKIIDQSGADILRLWVASVDYSTDIRISNDILKQITDSYRKMRNTFRFLLSNLNDFDYETNKVDYKDLTELDKWALSKLSALCEKVTDAYENFDFCAVYHTIYNFCIVEMSSFYLDIAKNKLYTYAQNDIERRSIQTVLHEILGSLVKLLAPVLTFTAEELWKQLPDSMTEGEKSVHLSHWPKANKEYSCEELEKAWEVILKLRDDSSKVLEGKRQSKEIGSSLEASLTLFSEDTATTEMLNKYLSVLAEVLIVSDVNIVSSGDSDKAEFAKGENTDIFIKAKKATGEKCARCWHYRDSVGQSDEHKDICHLCLKAITE